MSGHRHRHGEARNSAALVRGQSPEVVFSRAAEPRRTLVAAATAAEHVLAEPPASVAMALPLEVYLIGCGSNIAVQGEASAQTMGFKA